MWPEGGSRLRTGAVVWAVVAVAAGAVVWALPGATRFAVQAPAGFWAVAAAALLVDAPLFRRDEPHERSTLSVCFAVAIFAVWGAAPAIVVQAAAGAVTLMGGGYRPRTGLYRVARLVCAIVVAELVVGFLDPPPITEQGTGLNVGDLLAFAGIALMILVVNYGLLALARASTGRGGLRRATAEAHFGVFGTATSVLVVSPLLTTIPAWGSLLIAAPLLVLNGLLREQLRREKRLARDPVGGLLNRQGLAVGLRALAGSELVEPQRPFGIVLVNVESVLTINRNFGRDLYEELVGVASHRLVEAYGEDRVGRLSGEGVVILMPDLVEADAVREAEKVARVLAGRIEVDEIPFALAPVAGVALSPMHGSDLGTLMAKAELAVGEARRQGRVAVQYAPQTEDAAQRRVTLVRELHAALRDTSRHGEICVLYQPQVRLATGRLYGVEALVRWSHPTLGPIPTDELIEAIEPTDVMPLLTRHVLESVAAQLQAWNQQGLPLRAAVNVSVQDLRNPDFAGDVAAILRGHGIGHAQLTIEITERMVTDVPQVADVCRRLAHNDVGLSLDDFGTGHASLQQLRHFPLTEVKIDRSFISGIVTDPVDRTIVTGVQAFAKAAGAEVVAEGVEDARTAKALTAMAGIIGQGYYLGRPTTADALAHRRQPTTGTRSVRANRSSGAPT